jgi:hypothetical protein
MASNSVRSLLWQTAQEYDLLFPEGGLLVPSFLLKDAGGELHPGWRERYNSIVLNEWAVTEKVFLERPYNMVVEIREQLRERLARITASRNDLDFMVGHLGIVSDGIEALKEKHTPRTGLREALGEASSRSTAGKSGWSFEKERETYALHFPKKDATPSEPTQSVEIEFGGEVSLALVWERLQEYQSEYVRRYNQSDRSYQICSFKLQVIDALLWQFEMFGELVGLSQVDLERAADKQEEKEMKHRRDACNVPALRSAWEWMLRNRKRCWDPSGQPNRRALWQTMLLDPEHGKALIQISGPEKGKERISSDTADRYMERFEGEVGAKGLEEFRRALGGQL